MTGISNCNMSAGPRALVTSTISTIIHDIYMVTYRERDWRRDSPCKHQVRWTAQQPVWFWDLNAVHDWVALFTLIFFPPGVLTLPQVPHGASLIRAFLPWHFHVTTRCFSAAVWRIVIRGWHDGGCYSLNHRQGPITAFLFYAATSVCVSQCMCTHATWIISDRRGSSCHLCIWGGVLQLLLYVCLSPCWLPGIHRLLLTSVESSCQNEEKSLPPPLVLISSANLDISPHRNVKYALSPFTPRLTNWINLLVNLHKKKR